jgi:hypothetical protein
MQQVGAAHYYVFNGKQGCHVYVVLLMAAGVMRQCSLLVVLTGDRREGGGACK